MYSPGKNIQKPKKKNKNFALLQMKLSISTFQQREKLFWFSNVEIHLSQLRCQIVQKQAIISASYSGKKIADIFYIIRVKKIKWIYNITG